MQKILELIEQVRFAELEKIDKLSNARDAYMKESDNCDGTSSQ